MVPEPHPLGVVRLAGEILGQQPQLAQPLQVAVDRLHRHFQRFGQLGSGPAPLRLREQAAGEEPPAHDRALPLGQPRTVAAQEADRLQELVCQRALLAAGRGRKAAQYQPEHSAPPLLAQFFKDERLEPPRLLVARVKR